MTINTITCNGSIAVVSITITTKAEFKVIAHVLADMGCLDSSNHRTLAIVARVSASSNIEAKAYVGEVIKITSSLVRGPIGDSKKYDKVHLAPINLLHF